MKTFRDYLKEDVVPTAIVQDGSIDLEREVVRAQINSSLASVLADASVTPYNSLVRISKVLSYFNIILPKRVYLDGEKGIEAIELRQFGDRMGMNDQGEFIKEVPGKFYLFIQYWRTHPNVAPYAATANFISSTAGMFKVAAKIVDKVELDRLIDMAEVSLAESAESRQAMAHAKAPKEEPHTALGDCDCSQGDSPSTKSAVSVMMRRKDKKLSADSLDEAMTRKQKDMAVRRFMSHDPEAGERILKIGKKDREEKKSFASAKKEIKGLKEATMTHIKTKGNKNTGELDVSYKGRHIGSVGKGHRDEYYSSRKGDYSETDEYGSKGKKAAISNLRDQEAHSLRVKRKKLAKISKMEEEQLDELKKSTLASYIKKSAKSQSDLSFDHGEDEHRQYGDRGEDPDRDKEVDNRERKISNREKGINRAADKLAKEETQIDEISDEAKRRYVNRAYSARHPQGEKSYRSVPEKGSLDDLYRKQGKALDKKANKQAKKLGDKIRKREDIAGEVYKELKRKHISTQGPNWASGKLKEEQIDEGGMPASVIAHKQKLASMSDKEFAEKHGHKTEKALRDMAARHGYGFDKATKTGSDHYVKRAASAKQVDEAMGSAKKNYGLRKMKTKAKTIVRRGLGKERETQTILVTNKGDPHAASGGGVHRIPKDKYDPTKHNMASE